MRRAPARLRLVLTAGLAAGLGLGLAIGPAPAQAAAPKKIVLLINGTLGDKSFFDSAAHGLELIKAKYGADVTTKVIEMSYDESKWQATAEDIASQDWDLIIAGTYQMGDIVTQVSNDNPGKNFLIFDAAMDYSKGGFKNVYSISYKQNEGSYLAGLVGEDMIKSGKARGTSLGFLGGLDIPVINDFLAGYVAGAQAVDPAAKIAISYIGSFSDAAKGKELALAQYRTGTAIGFNVAGEAGLGQLAAAKETDHFAIGVDSDQSAIFRKSDPATADRVVTSVLKRVDNSLLRAFDLMHDGKLPLGREESLGLKEGAVGIVDNDVYKSVLSDDDRAKIAAASADIAAGKITVPTAFGMDTAAINAMRAKVRP